MLDKLAEISVSAQEELINITDFKKLEEWRVCYLGKKSELTKILRSLATLNLEERQTAGAQANRIKTELDIRLKQKEKSLKEAQLASLLGQEGLDVTLPGRSLPSGHLHLTTQTVREMCQIFVSMGFEVVEGPEVEWDYYNFESLNMPKDHAARDMWATLWVDSADENDKKNMLLRTHTSPMQIRIMEKRQPPLRVVMPGRVYRYEATDATHEWMFYQIEGLAVDTNITMADLKGTLFEVVRRLFGAERKVRFRCDYFPFVEPGVEVAMDCFVCKGDGCRLCSGTGWIEILGAGMVHPNVLRQVNYDPEIYTGFAFGMGIERIPMLRFGIDDIRLFYGNEPRFLKQF